MRSSGVRSRPARSGNSIYDETVYADAKTYGKHVGSTEPRIFTKPLRELTPETSHGFSVIAFAFEVLGIRLFPWQRALLIRALELNEDGTYRFRKIFIIVGRQNGKTTLLTVLSLWWLFMDADSFPEHLPAKEFLILGTAQNLDIAEEAWDAALKRCDPNPDEDDKDYVVDDLATETRKPVKTNGKKSLRLRNNAAYEPRAASRMGGRGKSAARVIMDEMREQQTWDVWGSVSKTKNAIFNSQLWGISSAGDAKSIVLQTLRDGAIRTIREYDQYVETGIQTLEEFANSHDTATALFEWSAPEKCKLLDVDAILAANPSAGYKPMFFESIWSDLLGDEPESTKRTEILCDWVTSRVEPFLNSEAWAECADPPVFDDRGVMTDPGSVIADGGRTILGVDIAGNRSAAYITAVGHRDDGIAHLELIAQRAGDRWVDGFLEEVRAATGINELAIQASGCPAADLVKPLREAGFIVHEIKQSALLNSAGRMKSRVEDRDVRHRGQAALNLSAENGTAKEIGGMPVWDLFKSPVDNAPMNACSNALYALEQFPPEPNEPDPPKPPAAAAVRNNNAKSTERNIATVAF